MKKKNRLKIEKSFTLAAWMPELVQGGRLKICCVRTRGFESHSKHNIQTVYIMLDVIYERIEFKINIKYNCKKHSK